MAYINEELEEINYLIRITDEEIQNGILENNNFQETPKGKKLIEEMNRYLLHKEGILEEIATAGDSDAVLRHRPTSNNFTPCELGECNCLHC